MFTSKPELTEILASGCVAGGDGAIHRVVVFGPGKCRGCGSGISLMYPVVEAITGAMFLGAYLLYGPSLLLVARLIFGCAMIVLFVIDLQHKILPNVITLPGMIVGLLLSEVAGPG